MGGPSKIGWLYIIIRTFPFWATPMGATLITAWWASQKRRNKLPFYYPIAGLILIGASAAFLIMKGHFTAVPAAHEMITGENPNPR